MADARHLAASSVAGVGGAAFDAKGWWSWRLAALERRVRLQVDADLSGAPDRSIAAAPPPAASYCCGSYSDQGYCVAAGFDAVARTTSAASWAANGGAFLFRHLAFAAAVATAAAASDRCSSAPAARPVLSQVEQPAQQPPGPLPPATMKATLLPPEFGFAGGQQRRRRRTHFTAEQTAALQKAFSVSPYLNYEQRLSLGAATGLSEQIVLIWFKNYRAKIRKSWAVDTNSGGARAANARLVSEMSPVAGGLVVAPSGRLRRARSPRAVAAMGDCE